MPGREIFSRCAKALLVVGAGPRTGYDRRMGMRLEIVPEANPETVIVCGEPAIRGAGAPPTTAAAFHAASELMALVERRTR